MTPLEVLSHTPWSAKQWSLVKSGEIVVICNLYNNVELPFLIALAEAFTVL